ncbi:hypothetical protein PAPYR_6442 [Paratrimastix pyriformis]|uniref:Uncharacterized protein n=1 Tax=Paratrimastix pyriformis TaxID=342808 RepID=A0ABQ8UJ10_9EUKA|nr:hypothetical protein PAPYR_6442 [Paratrimastix pyriformis]
MAGRRSGIVEKLVGNGVMQLNEYNELITTLLLGRHIFLRHDVTLVQCALTIMTTIPEPWMLRDLVDSMKQRLHNESRLASRSRGDAAFEIANSLEGGVARVLELLHRAHGVQRVVAQHPRFGAKIDPLNEAVPQGADWLNSERVDTALAEVSPNDTDQVFEATFSALVRADLSESAH